MLLNLMSIFGKSHLSAQTCHHPSVEANAKAACLDAGRDFALTTKFAKVLAYADTSSHRSRSCNVNGASAEGRMPRRPPRASAIQAANSFAHILIAESTSDDHIIPKNGASPYLLPRWRPFCGLALVCAQETGKEVPPRSCQG